MDSAMPLARGVGVDMRPTLSHAEATAVYDRTFLSATPSGTGSLLQPSGLAAPRILVVL